MPERLPDWRAEVRRRLETACGVEVDETVVEELAHHLELRYSQARAGGATAERAAAIAVSELEDVGALAVEVERRERRRPRRPPPEPPPPAPASGRLRRAAGELWHHLLQTRRTLVRRPGYAAVVAATLALGVGASTALFSVVDAVLLRPLPFPQAERLVLVWGTGAGGERRNQVSATDLADLRARSRTLEAAAFTGWRPILSAADGSERVPALLVGDGYFEALGARPLHGRLLLPEDQQPGRDEVVVLGYGLWRSHFGADPGIVGRTIRLNLHQHTVVGILQPDFASLPATLVDGPLELYRPLAEEPDETMRSARHLRAIGRLRPGATLAEAQTEVGLLADRLAAAHPATNTGYGLRVVSLRDDTVGPLRRPLVLLLAAAAGLLLVACVNAGQVVLAQGLRREREMAMRQALGASAARLVRQVLVESLLLALIGGLAGGALAALAVQSCRSLLAAALPALSAVAVDHRALAFALAAGLVTGAAAGVLPALLARRGARVEWLRSGTTKPSRRHRAPRALVAVEVAVAVVLVTGAGLLLRSVDALWSVDPGFAWRGVAKLDLSLPAVDYPEGADRRAVTRLLEQHLLALPGVEAAGVITPLPLSGNDDRVGFEVEGQPRPPGQDPEADRYVVTPAALGALRIPLLRGRALTDDDREDTEPVVLVSETLARRVWPGGDPIGRRIRLPWNPDRDDAPWRRVVGVVADVRQYGLDAGLTPQLYLPHAQYAVSWLTLVARGAGERPPDLAAVRRAVADTGTDLVPFDTATLAQVMARSIALRRLAMVLLGVFGVLALALSGLGIHGVVSRALAERTREIGVRMALGASGADAVRLVGRWSLPPTAVGVAVGLVAAAGVSPLAGGLLYGISPADPLTFALVPLVLVAVTLAACLYPALRASRVDPLLVLRQD